MKLREKNKFYTLMFVPHDAAAKTLSLRIPSSVLKSFIAVFLTFATVFSVSLLYASFLSGKLIHYKTVVQNSSEKDKKIEQIVVIKKELQEIQDQNNSLRRMLGLKVEKKKIKNELNNLEKVESVTLDINNSLSEIEKTKNSLEELKARVAYLNDRLASTPNSWPIRGQIMSTFGYRVSPWRGFHSGIDINAQYGSPVRATATGVVAQVGWMSGYGKVVKVNHGYGFSTLYAHNSVLAVQVGQKVTKGQIISYVGTSGYSTGPHCHYEVIRRGFALNPYPFLGMDVLTASRYF
ncbi:MAG: peptidase M23/M37 family [Candidatus Saganbacteria bacterium]|uniref:Peptidase M23/M37 family n=1 Tax=Candidatus Saganbacteria bacterium TaxID=2575572 RepID=A0A833L4S0_UNCSA|nr:MAG: peptidase M23/M37 family [Candidatus Saganbacteria bacterium]